MQKGQSYLFTHFSISASSLSPSQRLSFASRQLAHPEQTGQETEEEKGSRKEKKPKQAGLSKPHRDVMTLKFPDCLGRRRPTKYYLAQVGPGLMKSQNSNDAALFEDTQYYR